MIDAMWSAATGMLAMELKMDVISNNLANVDTNGYKKSAVDFHDLIYEKLKQPGAPVAEGSFLPTGIQVGHGVRAAAIYKHFSQGQFRHTEQPLDVLIEGDGFFQITMPDGTTAYTRDGAFKEDATGQMVTSNGYIVQPGVVIPENAILVDIGESGIVTAQVGADRVELGTMEVARFINPQGLDNLGGNLFRETTASGTPIVGQPGVDEGFGRIISGFLESSNVKAVREMVDMIITQRAYELNSKAIQTSDAMLQVVNTLKR